MSLLSTIRNYLFDYLRYRFKSARIAVALQATNRSRVPLGTIGVRDGAEPVEFIKDMPAYDADDMLRYWQVTQRGNLILKNNSSNTAYNIRLVNAEAIFDKIDRLEKLASLAPNTSISIPIEFVQSLVAVTGQEADALPLIPAEKQNIYLLIQYENESGKKMTTKFSVSFGDPVNEYTW
jgi:hypothetical protein